MNEIQEEVKKEAMPQKKKTSMGRWGKYGIVVIILLVALGTSGYLLAKSSTPNFVNSTIKKLAQKKAVATVNGVSITRGDLDKVLTRANGGQPEAGTPDAGRELQVLDDLVNIKLLTLTAKKEGLTVDDAKVQEQVKALIEKLGGEESFKKQLTAVGMTRSELEENIKNDLLIRALLDKNTAIKSITVSDAEIQATYDKVVGSVKGTENASKIPPLAEVKETIQGQIVQEKTIAIVDEYVKKLRGGADIKILLK